MVTAYSDFKFFIGMDMLFQFYFHYECQIFHCCSYKALKDLHPSTTTCSCMLSARSIAASAIFCIKLYQTDSSRIKPAKKGTCIKVCI